jgi:hypothetical protein
MAGIGTAREDKRRGGEERKREQGGPNSSFYQEPTPMIMDGINLVMKEETS